MLPRRWTTLTAVAVFVLALALYLATLAPTISWRFAGSDSGELAAAAFSWGVAHPTGYPLWTLLGFLITRIQFGDPAGRTSLLSALCGAGAAVFVALTVLRLSSRLKSPPAPAARVIAASGAGCAFGVAPAFWSQSILTEVYSLNALLIGVILWLLSDASLRPRPRGRLAFACGMALTNHTTSLLAIGAAAVTVVLRLRGRAFQPRALARTALLGLTPLLLYLLIPWRAAQHPAENWGDPQTLGRFVDLVSGAQYHYLLDLHDIGGALSSIPAIVRLFFKQFAWWAFPLAAYGLLTLTEVEGSYAVFALLTLAAYAGFTAVYRAEGAEYYLLPAYAVEAVLLGLGFSTLAGDLANWSWLRGRDQRLLPAGLAAAVLLSILPFAAASFRSHNLRHDYSAYDYAHTALAGAAAGATIETSDDDQTFALWYLQKVKGFRRDVHVRDVRLEPRGPT